MCGYGWAIPELVPLVYDERSDIYTKHDVTFASLSHLESIGLIHFQPLGLRRTVAKYMAARYYKWLFLIEMPKDADNAFDMGKVMLTKIGEELAPICGSASVDGFFEYVADTWKSNGYKVTGPGHVSTSQDSPRLVQRAAEEQDK